MPRPRKTLTVAVTGAAVAATVATLLAAAPPASASDVPNSATYTPLSSPTYTGDANPVPVEPAAFTANGMMQAMYNADLAKGAGTDFWMDRLLTRKGPEPAQGQDVFMSRGRAVFMRSFNPSALGLGGQLAYYDALGTPADSLQVDLGSTFTEDPSQRVQMPSHLVSVYTNGKGQTVTATKYITQNNVVVEQLTVASSAAVTIPVTVSSPLTTTVTGNEMTGQLQAYNNLTTVYPRLSGDGLTPTGGKLTGTLNVSAGGTVTTKVQLGLITNEIPPSRSEYDAYRAATPQADYINQVRTYNKWWADNIPYIDVPDANLKKAIYYRWWILRFNYLDADMPGNDFQFPTSIEGVLGYNNAIALTVPMFSQDLKYLRTADPSYGSWLSEGEVSAGGAYTDNPGDPANWSNTYTQYTTQSALQSWQLHGGPTSILAKLAQYGAGDVAGQLAKFDTTNENLLTYGSPALTGNDADAVSFDYRPGVPEQRPETAYVYANAMAAAQAYDLSGNSSGAARMRAIASAIQTAMNTKMWDPTTRQYESRYPDTGALNPWREINNYLPFTVGLAPNDDTHKQAFRFWDDPTQFSVFPMYTANQQDKAEATAAGRPGSNNFSHINSVIQFNLLASALRNYPSQYLTADTLKNAIEWAGWANFIGGDNRYPDSNEYWANWNPTTKQIDYRSFIHQTQLGATNYPIIEDVAGLQSRSDNKIEVSPIDIGYDHFAVTDIDYRGSNLSIVYDRDGGHYGTMPKGYSLVVNGKVVATSSKLTRLVYDPTTGKTVADDTTAVLTNGATSSVIAPAARTITDADTLQTLQKAGIDAGSTSAAADVATTAVASASFSAPGNPAAGANDGVTAVRPFWSDSGSGNAQDWYQLTYPSATTLDDMKLYFYDDQPAGGYAAPQQYTVQALVNGAWKTVTGQVHTPTYPTANYNHVQFPATTATAFRVLMSNPTGSAVGLREVQTFKTGATPPSTSNAAPRVTATVVPGSLNGTGATVSGTVADDGLPNGTLTSTWSKVSGPGDVLFTSPSTSTSTVRVSQPGTYVLRLSATDGALTTTADLTVTFVASTNGPNLAPAATTSASYTSPWEKLSAINTGTDPAASDPGGPGLGWATYPNSGVQYAELDWTNPVRLNAASAYFYDNQGGATGPNVGGVPLPQSWKLQAWNGTAFVDVTGVNSYPIADNTYNTVSFNAVSTTKLRYVLDGGTPAAGVQRGVGLRQVKAYAQEPTSITSPHVPTLQGVIPTLPATVDAVYAGGTRAQLPVQWPAVTASQVAQGGTSFTVSGAVTGSSQIVQATVYVRINSAVTITNLVPATVTTSAGTAPQLPKTVDAIYNDGSRDNIDTTVTWAAVPPSAYAAPGQFNVAGTVAGTALPAKATVTVTSATGGGGSTAAPVTTATASPAANGSNGWWTSGPVAVTLNAADGGGTAQVSTTFSVDGAGVGTYNGPITIAADGKHVVTYQSKDSVGNVEATKSLQVFIDSVAPTVTVTGLPAAGASGTGPVTATVNAADATSGVASTQYRLDGGDWTTYTAPVVVSASGQHTLATRAADVAGNTSAVRTDTFAIAGAASTAGVTLTSATPANAAGWYRSPVTFAVTAPAGSGLTAQYQLDFGEWTNAGKPVTVSRNALHVVVTRLVDSTTQAVAGSGTQSVFGVDTKAPLATIIAPDGLKGSPLNPVTLQWSGYDGLSGVSTLTTAIDGSVAVPVTQGGSMQFAAVGRHTVVLTVTDVAGNVKVTTATVTIGANATPSVAAGGGITRGQFTTVNVSGFARYETVSIQIGGVTFGSVVTDRLGRATLTAKVSSTTPAGHRTLVATGGTSGLTATTVGVLVR